MEENNKQSYTKAKLTEVNTYLTCTLCEGYYVDATTIVECLHSFCRSCIIRHLQVNSYCPICELMINTAKPNIKPDKTLQDIVYKLVPGLYASEMCRRRFFWAEHPKDAKTVSCPEARGQTTERIIFSPQDAISLSIEYTSDDLPDWNRNEAISGKKPELELPLRRYLQCPAMLRVEHLKKFIYNKYNVDCQLFHVDILHKRVPLPDHYTLMDIAYIYSWKRNEPMKFFFRITDIDFVSERFDYFEPSASTATSDTPDHQVTTTTTTRCRSKPQNATEKTKQLTTTESSDVKIVNTTKQCDSRISESTKATSEDNSGDQSAAPIKKSETIKNLNNSVKKVNKNKKVISSELLKENEVNNKLVKTTNKEIKRKLPTIPGTKDSTKALGNISRNTNGISTNETLNNLKPVTDPKHTEVNSAKISVNSSESTTAKDAKITKRFNSIVKNSESLLKVNSPFNKEVKNSESLLKVNSPFNKEVKNAETTKQIKTIKPSISPVVKNLQHPKENNQVKKDLKSKVQNSRIINEANGTEVKNNQNKSSEIHSKKSPKTNTNSKVPNTTLSSPKTPVKSESEILKFRLLKPDEHSPNSDPNLEEDTEKSEFFKSIQLTAKTPSPPKSQPIVTSTPLRQIPKPILPKLQLPKPQKPVPILPAQKRKYVFKNAKTQPLAKKQKILDAKLRKILPKVEDSKNLKIEPPLNEGNDECWMAMLKSINKQVSDMKKTLEDPDHMDEKNDRLQTLIDSGKLNIPSSLSITLTDSSKGGNGETDSKPNSVKPVQNSIEILKLPDTDPVSDKITETPKKSDLPVLFPFKPDLKDKILDQIPSKDQNAKNEKQTFQTMFELAIKRNQTMRAHLMQMQEEAAKKNGKSKNARKGSSTQALDLSKSSPSSESSNSPTPNSTSELLLFQDLIPPSESLAKTPTNSGKRNILEIAHQLSKRTKLEDSPPKTPVEPVPPKQIIINSNFSSGGSIQENPNNSTTSPKIPIPRLPINKAPTLKINPAQVQNGVLVKFGNYATKLSEPKTKPSPPKSPTKPESTTSQLSANQLLEKYNITNLAQLNTNFNQAQYAFQAMMIHHQQLEMQRMQQLNSQKMLNNPNILAHYENYVQGLKNQQNMCGSRSSNKN